MAFFKGFYQSIVYPFEDREWLAKIWPIPLLALIPVFGLFSLIIFKGWQFLMIRHKSKGLKGLPCLDFSFILKQGLLLWLTTFFYLLVPSIICHLLGMAGPLGFILDVYSIMVDGFDAWLVSEGGELVTTILIYVFWGFITVPVFQAGLIRYAVSGRWQNMLNIVANFFFVIRHIHLFLKMFLYWLMLIILIFFVDIALSISGVGLLLLPAISFSLYYFSMAYELGYIAEKWRQKCVGSISNNDVNSEPLDVITDEIYDNR